MGCLDQSLSGESRLVPPLRALDLCHTHEHSRSTALECRFSEVHSQQKGAPSWINVQSRIQIERPAGEVFAFVTDQTNAPRWQDGLTEVRRITDGPIGVGTEHVFVRQFAGRRIESRNRFTRLEPGRFVEFEVPQGWLTGTASYRVDPLPNGGC